MIDEDDLRQSLSGCWQLAVVIVLMVAVPMAAGAFIAWLVNH